MSVLINSNIPTSRDWQFSFQSVHNIFAHLMHPLASIQSCQIKFYSVFPRLPWTTFFPFIINLKFYDFKYLRISVWFDESIPYHCKRLCSKISSILTKESTLSLSTSLEILSKIPFCLNPNITLIKHLQQYTFQFQYNTKEQI